MAAITDLGTATGTLSVPPTITVTVPAGATIVAIISDGNIQLGSFNDGSSNSYQQIINQRNGVFGAIYYVSSSVALNNAPLTYTLHASSSQPATIAALYITGLINDPLDTPVTAGALGHSTAPSVISGVPNTPGDVFIGACTYGITSGVTFSNSIGWSTPPSNFTSATAMVGGGNRTNSAATALTFSGTLSATSLWSAMVVAFSPAGIPYIDAQNNIYYMFAPQRRSGSFARWEDSNLLPMPSPAAWQWSAQEWQPPHPRPERFAAISPKEDGNQSPMPPAAIWAFTLQELQPPRLRWERFGAVIPKEDGTENTIPPPSAWGYLIQEWQPPHTRYERFGPFVRWDDGNENPIPIAIPWAWSPQEWQPPRQYWERRFAGLSPKDDGTYAQQIRFFSWAWSAQEWQPPHFAIEKRAGAIMPREDGNELTIPTSIWFFPQEWQPPHPAPERRGGMIARKDDDLAALVGFFPQYDIQPAQQPRPTFIWARLGGLLPGDAADMNDQPPIVSYFQFGFENQPWQPPHIWIERRFAAVARGDDGTENIIVAPLPFSWEIAPPMLQLWPRPQARGAWFRGLDGVDAPLISFALPPPEQTASLFRYVFRSSPDAGDAGIEFPLQFIDAAQWQQPHVDLWRRLQGVAAEIEPSFIPLPPYIPWSENQGETLLHRRYSWTDLFALITVPSPLTWGFERNDEVLRIRRRVLRAAPQEKIASPLVFNFGFEPSLPLLRWAPQQRSSGIDRGLEIIIPLVPPTVIGDFGWQAEPLQYPRIGLRASGMMRGIDGTDYTFVSPFRDGWDPNLFWPPHPRREKAGAWMAGDVGSWGIFRYPVASGAIAADQALYSAVAYDVGLPP